MKSTELSVEFSMPDLDMVREAYAKLPNGLRARTLAAACRRAIGPGIGILKRRAPKGPTGNLQRAITIKSVTYNKNGVGAAVLGFTKAGSGKSQSAQGGKVRRGKDRAFHQFWIEFGTRERKIKVPASNGVFIASSFASLGPFKLSRRSMVRGGSKVVQSQPKYPKAFFKAAPFGQPLILPPMHPQAPIKKTWEEVKPRAAATLTAEMQRGLIGAQEQLRVRAEKAAAKRAAKG